MSQKLSTVIRVWGFSTIKVTIGMALLWPLLQIVWSILIFLVTRDQTILHEQWDFLVILKNFWNGGLLGLGLGFILGSFNLLFLFQNGNDKE